MIRPITLGRAIWSGLMCLLVLFLACSPLLAQQYRLESGDRIRGMVVGVTAEPYVTTVDLSGNIRIPLLGTFRAAGRTLDELIDDIALEVTGRQLRVLLDGQERTIVIDERDIFLDIESYRAVTVTGVVAAPGSIIFQPGMTARAAIGMAGGFALATASDDASRLSQARGRLKELQQTRAWLMADLWRIDVLLSDAELGEIPEEYASVLKKFLAAEDLDVVRQRVSAARQNREREREEVVARIALTESRIAFLTTALEQYKRAADNAESRLADLLDLANRGLTTANTVAAAEAGALNASSRMLTTEADLAQSEQQLQSLLGQREDVDAGFVEALLQEKSELERALAENGARIEATRDQIALTSILIDADTGTVLRIILYRRENGSETSSEISPSALLRPGDAIEVIIGEE